MSTTKTIFKPGNQLDAYIVGEFVTFKWNKRWKIISVRYDHENDSTAVKLVRETE